jgi:hypothetical protein
MSANENSGITKVEDFKSKFLIDFVKLLMENTKSYYIMQLEVMTKNQKEYQMELQTKSREYLGNLIKAKTIGERHKISQMSVRENIHIERPVTKLEVMPKPVPKLITIPLPRMPEKFAYLRPTADSNVTIDLDKLNPLIQDNAVNFIECAGPGERVRVKTNEFRTTEIILSKEEIMEIVNKFSKESRIPYSEGLYNVVFGRLILSADISESIGTKFTITKMSAPRNVPVPMRSY